MNRAIANEKKKCQDSLDITASGLLVIAYLVTLILIIVWLFKILHNVKKAPSNRNIYIKKDPSNYYEEGEFCYDNYENFIIKGALDSFGLPIKKLKKYTRALLGTIFISIGSIIISLIFIFITKCSYYRSDTYIGFASCFYGFFFLHLF